MSSVAAKSEAPGTAGRLSVAVQRAPVGRVSLASVNPYQPLVIVLAAACVGVYADRMAWWWVPQSAEVWWIVAAVMLAIWYGLWRKNLLRSAVLAELMAIAAVGSAWHHCRWDLFRDDELGLSATQVAQPVGIEAIARTAIEDVPAPAFDPMRSMPSGERSRMLVDIVAVRDGDEWRAASGGAQVTVDQPLEGILAGDRVRIYGQFEQPPLPGNPGELDAVEFARTERRLSVVRVKMADCVSMVEPGSGWNPRQWIESARRGGDELLSKYLDPEQAGLARAILLGQREDVDRATNEAFVETGTVHILCIAGLHMGIVAWILFLIFGAGWLPRRWAIVCVMAIVGAYMLLTTAQPPVIRATLLIWIVCVGMLLGRCRFGLNSLALAGLVLLAVNPSDLFRTGVQLSFVSVGILIWAGERFFNEVEVDPLDRLIAATRPWPQRAVRKVGHYLGEIFWVGAVLWVAIAPLVMFRFHVFSPVSLVLNVVLIPVVTVIMATGIGVLVFGVWLTPVAAILGWICNWCLLFLDRAVKWSVDLPGARLWVVGPSAIWLGVFYVTLAAMILAPRWMPPLRWRVALLAAWCGVALVTAVPKAPADGELRCTFIAVGHGGGELLEMPGGKTLLYDAGKLGQPEGGAQSISCYLWSRGISHLDAVVLSHADTDHYNSLPQLLKRFSVGVVYVSPVMFKQKSKALVALHDCIEQSGAKLVNIYAGDRLVAEGGVSIDVLHPPPDGVDGNDNANCVVLSVQYRGRKLLLTGDLGSPGMEMVMNDARSDYDVIQAPHHGSSYNDPEDFSKWTRPKWVFISGNMLDGNVAREIYADHGAKVLNTADCGAITATIDVEGNGDSDLTVETFHPVASADDLK